MKHEKTLKNNEKQSNGKEYTAKLCNYSFLHALSIFENF